MFITKGGSRLATILIRTVFFYIILTLLFKLMGKRQIGQLQMTEFATAVILSEAAALPITDNSIPISHGLVPLITLASLEVVSSFITFKLPKLRKMMDGSPIILVGKGEVFQKNLAKTRITMDEIFTEIRVHGFRGIDEVQYVILEQSGKMSVIPKSLHDRLTPIDIGKDVPDKGISLPIVIDGGINKNVIEDAGLTERWILKTLRDGDYDIDNVLFMTVDDLGEMQISMKEKNK